MAINNLNKKETRLANFIKYDTFLGKEQNIMISKESSFDNIDIMQMKGGVKLTQFYPQKIGQTTSTIEEATESEQQEETEENSKSKDKDATTQVRPKLDWEERLAKRDRL